MERYQQGKIYAIICRKTERRYIGSTCEPTLAKRLAKHVAEFKQWKEGKRIYTSFDIIKDGDYYIVLLESYPCNSKDELRMCEQKHIDLCECVNKQNAFTSDEIRLEQKKKADKTYREKHHDKIVEYKKQNRDRFAKQEKEHKDKHRDEINAKRRERVCCPNCQKEMSRDSLSAHKKICPQLKKEIVIDLI